MKKTTARQNQNNKTLYVPDKDIATWDLAADIIQRYHKKSLSAYLTEHLRQFLETDRAATAAQLSMVASRLGIDAASLAERVQKADLQLADDLEFVSKQLRTAAAENPPDIN